MWSKGIRYSETETNMERDNNNNISCGCTGCGCIMTIASIIGIVFAVTVLYKSCESGSLWKGAVSTTKEYYDVADSIWNDKQ